MIRTIPTGFSRLATFAFPVCAGIALLSGSLQAKAPIPLNLAGGLDVLVKARVSVRSAAKERGKSQTYTSVNGVQYTTQQAADLVNDSINNPDGRVMVLITLNGLSPLATVRGTAEAQLRTLTVTAVDPKYKAGVFEGWVSVDDVPALAETWGVQAVALEAKPEHNAPRRGNPIPLVTNGQTLTLLGTAFDQGVTQHRVDTINRFYNGSTTGLDLEGQGMQIGFISDSFGSATTVTSPATDVANFDLPGASNNPAGNTTPVAVLQDFGVAVGGTGGTDEGRAMVQIGYKMAPKAALAFATADNGEVGFANNIRALAGLPGYTYSGQTFAADVICDDVGYSDEPFFEDGIVAGGVNDANAAGVSYFSSAGNDIGTYDYDSDFRYVPNGSGLTSATNAALVNTNINLANVPTNLYQGGFHNFNPAAGQQDVALTYNLAVVTGSLPATNFQWNDPFNQTVTYQTPAIYTAPGSGDTSGGVTPSSFTTPTLTAGANYVIIVKATNNSPFDAIVTIKDPNGTTVVNAQDTGTDETVNFYPTITGQYTILVAQYTASTATPPVYPGGTFEVDVYTGNNSKISTDFNLLTFDLEGNYIPASSLVTNNLSTNVPYEYGKTPPLNASTTSVGEGKVQYLVARSAIPTITPTADHFRILVRGNGLSGIGPAEYFTYNTPNTKGHAMATGCNGTAAYSVFRPSVEEYFTSPGPATVYFNNVGTRLATPDVRLQPTIAAADNANNSFFASDDVGDLDTKPNFSGTSAAAPHAAACATLVLQAHGGRRSLTPAQVTSILKSTAFPHDLDPNMVTGSARTSGGTLGAGKVVITVQSDLALNPSAGAINPNSINVSYVGPSSIATLVFNPQGTAATAGNTTGGNNGVDAATTSPVTYFSNIYPGIVFEPAAIPFTLGSSTGTFVSGTDVIPTYGNLAPAPSNGTNQYWTMTLSFPTGKFTGGSVLRYTIGHGLQHNRTVNTANGTAANGGATSTSFTQADLFGGEVLIPDGTGNGTGMTFSGTTTDGGTFSGTLNNKVGAGWSQTEGFGFINAQAAASAPAP